MGVDDIINQSIIDVTRNLNTISNNLTMGCEEIDSALFINKKHYLYLKDDKLTVKGIKAKSILYNSQLKNWLIILFKPILNNDYEAFKLRYSEVRSEFFNSDYQNLITIKKVDFTRVNSKILNSIEFYNNLNIDNTIIDGDYLYIIPLIKNEYDLDYLVLNEFKSDGIYKDYIKFIDYNNLWLELIDTNCKQLLDIMSLELPSNSLIEFSKFL